MTSLDSTPVEATDVALTFFNDHEARVVAALAERIIPGDGTDPGATDAGVVYYVDRSLAGVSADLQVVYRRGLRALEQWCLAQAGRPVLEWDHDQLDDLLRRFIGPEVGGATGGLQFSPADQAVDADLPVIGRLLTIIREHTVEGFFCDPVYGGNRGAVGWALVGFPGAHWGYTAEQMAPGFDGRTIPIQTLSDLRRQLASLPPNETFTRNDTEGTDRR